MTDHHDQHDPTKPIPGGDLPDEDPIEAASDAAAHDEGVPVEGIQPGVDPDSADSSSALKRKD